MKPERPAERRLYDEQNLFCRCDCGGSHARRNTRILRRRKKNNELLTVKETAIVDLGTAVARGDQKSLAAALNRGFDNGLTLAEAKVFIGQLYAYCCFFRVLNAAVTLQSVVKEREAAKRPIPTGKAPPASPKGKVIDIGTANQTKLCDAPIKGPLFDFHPQLDEFLKAHLFGDIFARDNVDWRTRELLTMAALAGLRNVFSVNSPNLCRQPF